MLLNKHSGQDDGESKQERRALDPFVVLHVAALGNGKMGTQ